MIAPSLQTSEILPSWAPYLHEYRSFEQIMRHVKFSLAKLSLVDEHSREGCMRLDRRGDWPQDSVVTRRQDDRSMILRVVKSGVFVDRQAFHATMWHSALWTQRVFGTPKLPCQIHLSTFSLITCYVQRMNTRLFAYYA